MVGLPDAAVQEAKAASSGRQEQRALVFPVRRITVNFAPADLKKEGPFRQTGKLGEMVR